MLKTRSGRFYALVIASCTALAGSVAFFAIGTPTAGASGVPLCPPGQVPSYLSQGGRYPSITMVEQPAPATGVVSADAAFAAIDNSQMIATGDTTRNNYCASFALVTDQTQHLGGASAPLRYASAPMWAVYVKGMQIYPSGPVGSKHDHDSIHSAQVWFIDAQTGQFQFGITVG
jgi:hypothetical protein